MNVWSEHTVTIANKSLYLIAGFLGLVVASTAQAQAQKNEAAPALYGVQELQIQHGRVGNPTAAGNCGTSSGEIAKMVLDAFKGDGLPAFSVLGAAPARSNVARVDVLPDVVTVQPRDKECVSWVSLTVQGKNIIQVAPIETPRYLNMTYWTGGLMIGSTAATHPTAIKEAVAKLTAQFSSQYRNDQPPAIGK